MSCTPGAENLFLGFAEAPPPSSLSQQGASQLNRSLPGSGPPFRLDFVMQASLLPVGAEMIGPICVQRRMS